ncbi:MAG: response regulator transcription factor [Verrucomicrobiota bacterium]
MKNPIRILLADDHPSLRAGLASILDSQSDFQVVAEAGTGREVLEKLIDHAVDVFIVDLRMPDGDGIQTIRVLVKRDPSAKVLVLTTYDNEEDVFAALEAGARGYLLKDTTKEEIIAAVRQIHAGQRFLPQAIASRLADRMVRPGLTPRELDVLRLVSRGRANKEIASAMFISEETVKTHMKSLFQKLGVHDRAEAVAVSLQRGLIRM